MAFLFLNRGQRTRPRLRWWAAVNIKVSRFQLGEGEMSGRVGRVGDHPVRLACLRSGEDTGSRLVSFLRSLGALDLTSGGEELEPPLLEGS